MSEEEKQKSKPDEVSHETLIQKKKLFYKYSKKHQRTLNDDDIESITIQIRGSGSALLRGVGELRRIYTDTDFGDIVWDFDMDPTDPVRTTDADPDDPTDVIR